MELAVYLRHEERSVRNGHDTHTEADRPTTAAAAAAGPPNYIIITPYPFAPSKRERREHARRVKAVNDQILERDR